LAGRLANRLGSRCKGVIAICPPSHIDPKLESSRSMFKYIPSFLFDVFRAIDRSGGLTSRSVNRMVSPKVPADDEIRVKQLRWNLQVSSAGWLRTAVGFRTLTAQEWAAIQSPVFLIGCEDDIITPKEAVYDIQKWLGPASNDIEPVVIRDAGHAVMIEKPRVLAGLISDFIIKHVDEKLSLQWQLVSLASDKWSLKNEKKWRNTQSVGSRIEGTPLRGMKTLRQDDPEHSPSILEEKYPDIGAIIDISREPPPYDPQTFKRIRYHKFPTVSKLPPTKKEVKAFIELVNKCIMECRDTSESSVAVHCHYGFNRTGFFICSYMVEQLGFSIKDAVDLFGRSRTPGIRHPHFIDELYVRYEL
jgi:hypothetical protein